MKNVQLLAAPLVGSAFSFVGGVGHLDVAENAETVGLIRAFLDGA